MQRELTMWYVVFGDGVLEQRPKQRGAFRIGDAPADHPAAENVQDHVEIEIGPLCRPHQFGDVPRPDLVGLFGQQFGFLVDGMTQLPTPLANFAMLAQQLPVRLAVNSLSKMCIQVGVCRASLRPWSRNSGFQKLQAKRVMYRR
jgi:hypothetical protein